MLARLSEPIARLIRKVPRTDAVVLQIERKGKRLYLFFMLD